MALRALKTDEEIAAIPLDQPILVELPGGVIDDIDDTDDKGGKVEKTGKTETVDNGAKVLQEQLEASQRAQESERARADKAEREAADARKAAAEANKRTTTLETDVITGGLAAAQADVKSAKAAYKTAFEAGDADAMADAQERIGRGAAKVLNYEAGAAEIAERKEIPEVRQEQTRQITDPIQAVDSNPNLFPAEKEWLKSHPDAITDTKRNNELGVGYERALKKGLVRGTPDYFAFLNEFMGYEKPATNDDDNQGRIDVSAPVTRTERDTSGKPSSNRVTLSPEQREMAKNLGVSELDYAKNLVKFQAAQKADPEKYGNRS